MSTQICEQAKWSPCIFFGVYHEYNANLINLRYNDEEAVTLRKQRGQQKTVVSVPLKYNHHQVQNSAYRSLGGLLLFCDCFPNSNCPSALLYTLTSSDSVTIWSLSQGSHRIR